MSYCHAGPLISNGVIIGIYVSSLRDPVSYVGTIGESCLAPTVLKVAFVNLAAPIAQTWLKRWDYI